MAVNLTPGAVSRISTGKCTWKDLKPVLQVIGIANEVTRSIDNKQWRWVALSDGSFFQVGLIAHQFFISSKLQNGSIVQLTKFQLTKSYVQGGSIVAAIGSESYILVSDLKVVRIKCDIVGDSKRFLVNETPFVVSRTTPTITEEDHVEFLLNEENDDTRQGEEPPTSKQKKKRKIQSNDDRISGFGKENGLGACYKKLGTLEEGVSKMTKMMMERNKEDDMGFKKLGTLEEEVSKLAKTMMEKSKEDDAGACYKKLNALEEEVSTMTRMMMEKNKEDVVGFNKLETLEEDVSKLTRMMVEKGKEDDMGACVEKLDKMGWGAEDPLYDTALLLFLKGAEYRKLWLHLKPERCGKWLKIAGSTFGLLD